MLKKISPISTPSLLLTISVFLITAACLFPSSNLWFRWLEDHASYIILGELSMGLLFFTFNRTYLMMVCFSACALLCWSLHNRTQVSLKAENKEFVYKIRVANFNLNTDLFPLDSSIQQITRYNADLLSIQAIPQRCFEMIEAQMAQYGYSFNHLTWQDSAKTYMAVFSKIPLDFVKTVQVGQASNIVGKVRLNTIKGDRAFHFICSYVAPATDEIKFREMQKNIDKLAIQSKYIRTPLLAFGHYNLSIWSQEMAAFQKTAGIKNSWRGGYMPIWQMPKDHIFYSKQFNCISFETISRGIHTNFGISGTYQFVQQDSGINVKRTSQEF